MADTGKSQLELNRAHVDDNRDKLMNVYLDKFILVVKQEVVGSYDNYESAADAAIDEYGLDSGFYIEQITKEKPINFAVVADL